MLEGSFQITKAADNKTIDKEFRDSILEDFLKMNLGWSSVASH